MWVVICIRGSLSALPPSWEVLMNLRALAVSFACLILGGCLCPHRVHPSSSKFLTYANSGLELIPGEYLVMFDSNAVSETSVTSLANSLVAGTNGTITYIFTKSLRGFAVKNLTEAWADTVSRRPDVSLVRKDFRIYGKELRGGAFAPVPWNLDRVDQRAPFTLDRDYRFKTGSVGKTPPVPIYILDNGVYPDHQEFKDAAGNSRLENVADVRSTNFARCLGTDANHGTSVASIAAGLNLGITPTLIKNIKVLDREPLGGCTGGTASTVAMGLDQAYNNIINNGITKAVLNLSLGWYASTPDVATAISSLQNKNVVVVAAGGNEDKDANGFSPANLQDVVAVGATNQSDARAVFSTTSASNFGRTIALWAPGFNIKVADWPATANITATTLASGTSEAAPHVAGAVALLWQQNPNMTATQVVTTLKARATRNMLTNLGTGSTNTLLYVGEDAPAQGATSSIPRSGKNGDLLAVGVAWGWKRLYVAGGDISGMGTASGPYAYAGYDITNLAAGPVWQVGNATNVASQDCLDIKTTGLGSGGGIAGSFAYLGCMGTHNGAREAVVIAIQEDNTLLWQQPAWLGAGSVIRGVTADVVEVPGGVQLLVFAIGTRPTANGTEVFITSLDMEDGHQVASVVLTAPGFTEQFHQAVDLVLVDTALGSNSFSTDLVAATYSDPPGPDKTFLWKLRPWPLQVLDSREVPVPQLAINGMFATALAVQPLEDNLSNISIPGEVFLAAQTTVVDGGRTVPWGYIYRLNPDRVTVHSNIELVKEAFISSLWSEDGDLYFAGSTTRTFPPGNLFGNSKPGANPDYDAFLGKSEGIINTRRWMVTFNTPGTQNNSGYGGYGAKKGYIVGSDLTTFYVVEYPVY